LRRAQDQAVQFGDPLIDLVQAVAQISPADQQYNEKAYQEENFHDDLRLTSD